MGCGFLRRSYVYNSVHICLVKGHKNVTVQCLVLKLHVVIILIEHELFV